MDAPDRRLKTAAELFANGRFADAGALAGALWQEGDRSPELAILSGELALLRNRLGEAETALRVALQALEGHPRLLALLAETLRRGDRLAEAAEIYRGLGRTGMANKIGALATCGAYRLAGKQSEVRWLDGAGPPAVSARVNGREANLILDTGVGETLLDAALARETGVAVQGAERIHFPSGPAGIVEHGILDSLRLGGLEVESVPVQLHETRAAFADLLPFPVDGVIGTGLFSRLHSTLDYQTRTLRLDAGRRLHDGEPLYLAGEQYPLVEARLNDRLDTLLFLDTGMSGTAIALPLSSARLAEVDVALDARGTGYGVGSTLDAHPMRCREVRAAGSIQRNIEGMLMANFALERRFGFRIGGLLGDGFVNRGVLELDFVAGLVRLRGVGAPPV